MPQQTMTLTMALAYLKKTKAQIDSTIRSGAYIAVARGLEEKRLPWLGTNNRANVTVASVENNISASYQKITALMANYEVVNAAKIAANNSTMVKIGDKEMSIAQAIALKESFEFKKNLLAQMKQQAMNALVTFNTLQQAMEAKIDETLKPYMAREKKPDQVEIDFLTKDVRASMTPSLIDPISINENIDSLEKEVEDFLLVIDYGLSTINATTSITVDLQ